MAGASSVRRGSTGRWCDCEALHVARVLFGTFVLVGLVMSVLYFELLKDQFSYSLRFIRSLGVLQGSIVLCGANVVGALLFLPCLPFTLAAGFLYGIGIGSLVVTVASNLAAVISFLTARHLARGFVEKKLGGKGSKFRAIDSAIKKDGFRIIFLIRSSPIHPYGVANYLFGITSVSLFDFTVAGAIAMVPATVMEVYFGTAVKNVADLVSGHVEDSPLSRFFFYGGLLLTFVVTVVVTWWVKKKLDLELSASANSDDASSLSSSSSAAAGVGAFTSGGGGESPPISSSSSSASAAASLAATDALGMTDDDDGMTSDAMTPMIPLTHLHYSSSSSGATAVSAVGHSGGSSLSNGSSALSSQTSAAVAAALDAMGDSVKHRTQSAAAAAALAVAASSVGGSSHHPTGSSPNGVVGSSVGVVARDDDSRLHGVSSGAGSSGNAKETAGLLSGDLDGDESDVGSGGSSGSGSGMRRSASPTNGGVTFVSISPSGAVAHHHPTVMMGGGMSSGDGTGSGSSGRSVRSTSTPKQPGGADKDKRRGGSGWLSFLSG